jgi:hypothetical protein
MQPTEEYNYSVGDPIWVMVCFLNK